MAAGVIFAIGCAAPQGQAGSQFQISAEEQKQISGLMEDLVSGQSGVRTGYLVLYNITNQFFQILANDAQGLSINQFEGTCPTVTTNPPLDQLGGIPSSFSATADYGSGCTSDDGSVWSGNAVINATDITQNGFNFSTNYTIYANNVVRNGTTVANGTVPGNAALTLNGSNINVTINASFSNFQTSGYTLSGQVSATASGIDLNTGSFSRVEAALTNFGMSGMVIAPRIDLVAVPTGTNSYLINVSGTTLMGPVDLEVAASQGADGRFYASTTRTGSVAGYAVNINNVVYDMNACSSCPIGGSITFGSQEIVFTDACNCDFGLMFAGGAQQISRID
jgi:hypothetical protein